MNDERPPRLWWGMWKRFLIAAVLIVALSAGATATVALNTVSGIAEEVFPKLSQINAPKGLVTPEYNGGPETFLILGSDRREGSRDLYDRTNPPHSDTLLLVRFDPEHGQTSVMSIPRDLMVNIKTPSGQYYPSEKVNAAYTIGSKLGGTKGGMLLAAETIKREVFPGLTLNAIVDVNFKGFIRVVDALGCAYVNVDHRYIGGGALGETLLEHQPPARLPEALLRKRAVIRALPPHGLGLRARRPPAGLPARPARAGERGRHPRPDRHRRQGGRATRSRAPSTARRANC